MKKYFSTIFLASLALIAGLSELKADTLSEALSYAYDNNHEILAQRAYLQSVKEKMPQAMAGFKPTVSLDSSVATRHTESNGGSSTNRNPYDVGVSVSQPLFNGFATIYGVKSADNVINVEKANLRAKEQNVLLDAVTAYMNVVRDEAVLKLRLNNEQVLSRKLEATIDRYNVGEITKTDVAQAEARLMGAQAARILAEGELEASKAYYVQIIGKQPVNLEPEPKYFAELLPKSLEDAIKTATIDNPNVVASKYSVNAAENDIEIAKADFLPTIALKGSAGRSWNQSSNSDRTDSFQITANLDIPLYTAGMANSRLRSAKHITSQRKNNLNNTIEIVREAVTRLYKNLGAIQASIRATIAQVDASEIALEGVEKEAEVGSRTLLDVLDAEQELLDAKVNLVTAKRDETITIAGLLVAIGHFAADNIGLKR